MKMPEELNHLQQLAETNSKAQFALAWFYLPEEIKQKMNFIDERYSEYQLAALEGLSIGEEIVFPITHYQHDLSQGFEWLKKSAESGFKEAYYPLAFLYLDQEYIFEAEKLAKQSENSGFKESNLILGKINAQRQQYALAYDYYVKALHAGIQLAYGPMMKIVLKGYVDTDQAKTDIEKFKPFMQDRLKKNLERCNDNRFFGQEIKFAGLQEIDVPTDEDDDNEFENSLERIETDYQWMADQLVEVGQQSINRMRELQAKDRELEETMAMFAHKFRSPLDAILYNTNHEHQPKLYIQAAQTMQSLLDIFSTIATDAEHLQERLVQDNQGNGNLMNVLTKTLDMILLHLLSVSASEKIQQHYVRYAKAQGLCPNEISDKQWNEDYFELEQQLQAEWEHSFAQLLNQSPTIQQRLAWLEPRFFKLELQGFDASTIQFRDYGITESFLTILLNEILVNAFKYYASDEQQAVVLAWTEQTGYQVLSCRNPCTDKERSKLKGSGKGHTFLSALARKSGSQFTKPKVNDDFVLEFGIANQLLITS
jgi:signal transduction histidine kinase